MPDLRVSAPAGSNLHEFLHGSGWSAEYARKSFPVLVRWAEEQNADPSTEHPEHTYKELATVLGDVRYTHAVSHALGVLGFTLNELQGQHPGIFGNGIPPIEMLVWTQGAGRPGDDAFSFVGISKSEVKNLPEPALQAIAARVRQEIIAYPHWRVVLKALKLRPLTIDLPAMKNVVSDPGFRGRGGGESREHRCLKYFVLENYSRVGLKGKHIGHVEEVLLSGDQVDVFFENEAQGRLVGVEVKSRISSEADLIRGVFQCVKYRAVLKASEEYEISRTSAWSQRAVGVLLVTERPLPAQIAELAKRLGVTHVVVKIPDDYVTPMSASAG